MKNKLLLTSALVSAVSLSAIAQAEVKIGASHEQTYAMSSMGGTGQTSDGGLGTETNLSVSGSKDLSNGLKVGLRFNWEMDGSDAREYAFTVGNSAVDVIFANDFTQDITTQVVPRVGEHPGTVAGRGVTTLYQDSIGGSANEVGQRDHMAIALKGIAGGNIVAIYSPKAGTNDDAGLVATGSASGSGRVISYVGKPVEGLTVALATNRIQGDSNSVAASSEDKEDLIGASYSMGKFAVGAERRKKDDGNTTGDLTGTYYGATFNVSDNLSLGVARTKLKDDNTAANPEEKMTMFSVGYNFGGLGVEVSYVDIENASNSTAAANDGKIVQFRTVAAF